LYIVKIASSAFSLLAMTVDLGVIARTPSEIEGDEAIFINAYYSISKLKSNHSKLRELICYSLAISDFFQIASLRWRLC